MSKKSHMPPTYRLVALHKASDASSEVASSEVAVAFPNDGGSLSLVLNVGTVLDWHDHNDVVLTLSPVVVKSTPVRRSAGMGHPWVVEQSKDGKQWSTYANYMSEERACTAADERRHYFPDTLFRVKLSEYGPPLSLKCDRCGYSEWNRVPLDDRKFQCVECGRVVRLQPAHKRER